MWTFGGDGNLCLVFEGYQSFQDSSRTSWKGANELNLKGFILINLGGGLLVAEALSFPLLVWKPSNL